MLSWVMKFEGGPLDGKTLGLAESEGEPPPTWLARHSIVAGWHLLKDEDKTRLVLERLGDDSELMRYVEESRSQMTDEQVEGNDHVVRGVVYRVEEAP